MIVIYCSTFFRSALFFLVVSARVCDLKVAALRPWLWVLRERNESFSLFLCLVFCVWRELTFGHCVRCGMALYEQARQATPQPPQANAYALAIMQSRCTHLNMRLPCIGVLRFNAPAQRRLAKSPIVRPRLWVLRERNESFSLFFVWFFVFGESRPLVVVCVAVWLYTSKLAKPHPNPHRLTPMLSP